MVPYERHELILDLLRKERFIKMEEMMKLTGSSLTTLRRDLSRLAETGRVRKFRGGVLLNGEPGVQEDASPVYQDRQKIFQAEKERIGLATQRFIQERDVLIMLNGTTTLSVARNLDPRKHVTIITNGIDIVSALRDKPCAEVIMPGGSVDYLHNVLSGPLVLKGLKELHATKLISGAGGLSEARGLTIYPYTVSSYYQQIVDMVEEVIIVCDHSKIGRVALVQATTLDRVHTIVTDAELTIEYRELFDRYGIRCVIV